MAHDVFISYSSRDKSMADAVCARLESAGIRCWIAPRDVPGGGTWAREIAEAVRASRVMVLIFSSITNQSTHVRNELNLAVDNKLVIIPFKIENASVSDEIRYYTGTQHWLDAITPPLEAHLQKLIASVRLFLNKVADDGEPVVSRATRPGKRDVKRQILVIAGAAALTCVGLWSFRMYAGSSSIQPVTTTREEAPSTGWDPTRSQAQSTSAERVTRNESPGNMKQIHRAICGDDVAGLSSLLRGFGASRMQNPEDSQPFLHVAVSCGAAKAVDLLLSAGAYVDAVFGPDRETALLLAVRRGNTAIVRRLLDGKANTNLRRADNKSPLHIAASSKQAGEIIPLLLAAGADTQVADQKDQSPMHVAAFYHSSAAVKAMAGKVDVNKKDAQGATPLHLAIQEARRGDLPSQLTIRALLEAGAKADIANSHGQLPAELAQANQLEDDVIASLARAGSQP